MGLENGIISAKNSGGHVYAGMVVSELIGGLLDSVYNTGDVYAEGSRELVDATRNTYSAGIVSINDSSAEGATSVITHCYNTGYIHSYGSGTTGTGIQNTYSGGIASLSKGEGSKIEYSFNSGEILVEGGLSTSSKMQIATQGGGIVGATDTGIEYCYNEGIIKGVGAGKLDSSDNSVSTIPRMDSHIGGIVGSVNFFNTAGTGFVSNCYNIGFIYNYGNTVSSSGGDSNIRAGGIAGCTYNSSSLSECYNVGDIMVYGSTGNASGDYGVYVGGVVGRNESSSISDCYNVGDVMVYGSTGTASGNYGVYVGGVVGYNYNSSSVRECYNVGSVMVYGYYGVNGGGGYAVQVGGVVGLNVTSCSVSKCYNVGSVLVYGSSGSATGGTYNVYVGGVVGYNETSCSVDKCFNLGSVTAYGSTSTASGTYTIRIGGVVGYNYGSGSIDKCFNLGSVTGYGSTGSATGDYNVFVGGVAGKNNTSSSVDKCFNLGSLTGYGSTGSATGNYYVWVGGVIGYSGGTSTIQCTISNSYNMGSVTGYGWYGVNGSASGDYYVYVGGVVGVGNYTTISSCFNEGDASGTNANAYLFVGGIGGGAGLVGTAVLTNNYWLSGCGASYGVGSDGRSSGSATNTGATPMTSSNMKLTSFVTTLNNGSNAWLYDTNNINNGYPILSGTESVRAMETNYINNIQSNTMTIPSLLEWIEDTFIPNSNYTTLTNQIELIRANTTTLEPIADTSWYKAEEREYHLYDLGDILGIQEILEGTRTREEVEGLEDKTLYIENDIDIGIL